MFNNIMQFFRICNPRRDDTIKSIIRTPQSTPIPSPHKMTKTFQPCERQVSDSDINKSFEEVIKENNYGFIDYDNRDAYFAKEQQALIDALSEEEIEVEDENQEPAYFDIVIGDGLYLNLGNLPKDGKFSLEFVNCNIHARHCLTKRKIEFPDGDAIFYKGELQGYFDCDGTHIDERIYTIVKEQIKKTTTYTYTMN